MAYIVLKPGREKSVLRRHPWLFSGAIQNIEGQPVDGDVVDVLDSRRSWLARGYLNRKSQIVVRLLTWDSTEQMSRDFWQRRLALAIDARSTLAADDSTTAFRLVYAESDGLPGLVVDRYADWLVVQFLTLGIDRQRPILADLLMEMLAPRGIYERSDVAVRGKEGLKETVGPLAGAPPPPLLEVREHGLRFLVDVVGGQKTGFYLDQRENRWRVSQYARGQEVLNGFSFSGGFGVYAMAAGATKVINVDTSLQALEQAERNLTLNGFDPDRQAEQIVGDVFELLRDYRAQGRRFAMVILDPPKFALTRSNIDAAARGYKDINLLAMQILNRGGILATFSCSGLVSADLFQKIVFGASVDARRDVQILEQLGQPPDHPVLLTFPEGAYLKGFVCRVL
jgi:23S rRNA (cytosine1962-C5)-methyltransferase